MNEPCIYHTPCVDPANPLANTSAEAPDPNLFLGYNSSFAGFPPIDSLWSTPGCISQCVSSVSQEAADICAANQQILCTVTDGGGNGGVNDGGGWVDPVTGLQYPLFLNDAESCTVNCPDGLPFTYTLGAGSLLQLSRARADAIATSVACQRARAHRLCLSDLDVTEVCLNGAYMGKIVATGATVSPLNTIWTNPGGGLPFGISMSFDIGGGTLTLIGTAKQAGSYTFTIACLTPAGDFMSKNYTICVVDINPSSLPAATSGTAYNQTLTATCGQTPLNWQVTSGALPPGLSLDQTTGIISGTPTQTGNFSFTVTVQTGAT